jgi:serine/threonine-protein phosphatase 5
LKVAPNDPNARSKLQLCQKEQKRIEFEEAIFVDTISQSIVEQFADIDSMVVEETYDGPHLSPNGITLDFVKELLEHMKKQKRLHKKYTIKLLLMVKEYFEKRQSIEDVTIPEGAKITVCGDIHGQYYDLLNVFDMNGLPSESNMYLWNGDFVDRGSFSVECILALFAFKLLYPDSVFLSRGNHETDDMNRVYGFEGEVKAKYNQTCFKLFSETFNAIPLGNLIQEKILVIHGGLFSRDNVSIQELREIDRFKQVNMLFTKPGTTGLMCELLWSDPQFLPGRSPSNRGVGLQFGPDVTQNFLEYNNLKLIIRSHQVKPGGYEIAHNGQCITIFSAPNYCDMNNNMGAYIHITPDLHLKYHQFEAAAVIIPVNIASSNWSHVLCANDGYVLV